jgi:hypothetical protein
VLRWTVQLRLRKILRNRARPESPTQIVVNTEVHLRCRRPLEPNMNRVPSRWPMLLQKLNRQTTGGFELPPKNGVVHRECSGTIWREGSLGVFLPRKHEERNSKSKSGPPW